MNQNDFFFYYFFPILVLISSSGWAFPYLCTSIRNPSTPSRFHSSSTPIQLQKLSKLRKPTYPLLFQYNKKLTYRSNTNLWSLSKPTLYSTSSLGRSIPVGIYNIQGTDPDRPNKVNQDAHFHVSFQNTCAHTSSAGSSISAANTTVTSIGVLDGHGQKGHLVSNFFAKQVPFRLQEQMLQNNSNSSMDLALIKAFELSQEDAIQNNTVPAGRSGTTCVTITIQDEIRGEHKEESNMWKKRTIYTANVGDSRAILGFPAPLASKKNISFKSHKSHRFSDAIKEEDAHVFIELEKDVLLRETNETSNGFRNNKWISLALTNETTTKIPAEKARIDAGEGRIDAIGNVFYGPVGISMTRALGDAVMKRAGVISTPIVDCFELQYSLNHDTEDDNSGVIMVLGSDGIFDVMKNQDIVDLVVECMKGKNDGNEPLMDGRKVHLAAERISKTAKKLWQGGLPLEVKSDDITCAVILL